MTTATRFAPAPSPSRRARLPTVLEAAMVVVGLAIGAAFFSSIWSEPAHQGLQAAIGPAASHVRS
jgi:hypothetical protein